MSPESCTVSMPPRAKLRDRAQRFLKRHQDGRQRLGPDRRLHGPARRIGGSVEATLDKARHARRRQRAPFAGGGDARDRDHHADPGRYDLRQRQCGHQGPGPSIVDEVGATVKTLNQGVADIKAQVATVLASIGGTSQIASERLIELRAPSPSSKQRSARLEPRSRRSPPGRKSVRSWSTEGNRPCGRCPHDARQRQPGDHLDQQGRAGDMPVIVFRRADRDGQSPMPRSEQVGNDLTGASGNHPADRRRATTLAAATRTFQTTQTAR